MSVLQECPQCHRQQSIKNKKCKGTINNKKCGLDLVKARKSNRVRFWITYRLPGGRQKKEFVGFSIKEAQDADGKRKAQKRENKIFEISKKSKMTFKELTDWYLDLTSVKKLASYDRVVLALNNFNDVFGKVKTVNIKLTDLEDYQEKRLTKGRAPATIDMEIKLAQTALKKACDNDLFESEQVLKPFKRVKRLLKQGDNARKSKISIDQYLTLLKHASQHYRAVLIIAFNSGMRLGEIRSLKWSYIDKENQMIRLPKDVTKEGKTKDIPINYHIQEALNKLPVAINHNFVITFQGQPMNAANSLKKQFSDTCKKADIPYGRKVKDGVTFHDIRRTFKTNMFYAGVAKEYRDAICGHSLKGMDRHYLVINDDDLKQAMEKYTNWLDEQIIVAENVAQNVAEDEENGKCCKNVAQV